MPRYRYTATDLTGNKREGDLESSGPEQVESALRADGLWVESVTLIQPTATSWGSDRLSDLDVAEFTRHVAGLNKANLPLASGLRALGDELASGRLRRALLAMSADLDSGRSLEDAVEVQGDRFPRHLRGLVLAGVRSGKLGETLELYARYQHIGRELKRKLWISLAYPVMLIGLLAVLFIFVSTGVVNQFAVIFSDFGVALPRITTFLVQVSRSVAGVGPWVILGLLASALVVWILGLTLGGSGWRHGLTTPIPLIGPLWRWIALVEFSHLLGLLLESELPLPLALQLTGEGIRDSDVSRTCRVMRKLVEMGLPLSESMERLPEFPQSLSRILRWAESSHSLPGALHLAGDMYESRARAQASFVGVACTTITVVFVLTGAIFLCLGLFLPLIQLIARLAG